MRKISFAKTLWGFLIIATLLLAWEGAVFVFRKEPPHTKLQPTPSPSPSPANRVFEPNAEWKPVDMNDLNVKAGSALDWEGIVPRNSAIPLLRLVIGSTGKLEAEGKPGEPIRLMGTGENTPWVMDRAKSDPQWKATWKNEAVQARRQGYDLIRIMLDAISSDQDYNLTPDLLDKADFFIATMGEEGVYTFLTIGSYGVFLKNPWGPLREGQRRDYRLRMYLGDPEIRKAWKYGAETLMAHVNAYTGLAWKDDPRIACVELFNEQEWGFLHPVSRLAPQTRREFDEKYREWLKAKYGTPEQIAKAWKDTTLTDFTQVAVPDQFPEEARRVRDNDFIQFCAALSDESARWMRETLRATGYRGLTAQYNMSHWLAGQEVRWRESQVTIANAYHSHPSAFESPGSKCNPESSVKSGGWYWRSIASMRFADRPFIETEYNHPYWNPYQYEGGILFGAYSALQGLDGLMVHEGAVFSYAGRPGLGIFTVGNSPTLRANQFLLGCLYRREDVRPSPHRVELVIPEKYLKTAANGARPVSGTQNKIALMTGFSIAFPWAKPAEGVGTPSAPDWTIEPSGDGSFQSAGGGWAIGAGKSLDSSAFSLDAAVAHLKAVGILPADNLSDPGKGIFQSDTGQIIMRVRENLLKVATPRSEAVTLEAGKSERIGVLDVLATSLPGLVAACSVDQEVLAHSKRIVLIYATDTVNTGLKTSPDRTTLIDLGTQPVLMKTGILSATIENVHADRMSLYALGLDGSRREKLPLKASSQALSLSIDTSTLKNGPTPFFELVAE